MSMWARVETVINNPELFKRVIDEDDALTWLTAEDLIKKKRDAPGAVGAFCVKGEENSYSPYAVLCTDGRRHRLEMDHDPRYSPIARLYGRNAEKIMQKYAVYEVEGAMRKQGGALIRKKTTQNGAVVLQYKVA